MKTLLFLGLIVGGLCVAGVIHINRSGDEVQITIDKKKAAATAERLLEKGRDFVDDAEESVEDARQTRYSRDERDERDDRYSNRDDREERYSRDSRNDRDDDRYAEPRRSNRSF